MRMREKKKKMMMNLDCKTDVPRFMKHMNKQRRDGLSHGETKRQREGRPVTALLN